MSSEGKITLAVVYDPMIARTITRGLKREPDMNPVEVVNGFESARDRILLNTLARIDAVITDWTIVDGAAVIQVAQQQRVRRIILIDGKDPSLSDQQRDQFRNSGVVIVDKPFNMGDLSVAIKKITSHDIAAEWRSIADLMLPVGEGD